MAEIDIVDHGDYVEIYPITHRIWQAGEIGFSSVRVSSGSPVYPPQDDGAWSQDVQGFDESGKKWITYLADYGLGWDNLTHYFEGGFAGEWWDEFGSVWSNQVFVDGGARLVYGRTEGLLWFDCSGLPDRSYDRVEYILAPHLRSDVDGLSWYCDLYDLGNPISYDGGALGEYYMPPNYSNGSLGDPALDPPSLTLASMADPATSLVPDLEDENGNRIAWPLQDDVRLQVIAGETLVFRFGLTPPETVPSGSNRIFQMCDYNDWDGWDGSLETFSSIADRLPRLRLYVGEAEKELLATGSSFGVGRAQLRRLRKEQKEFDDDSQVGRPTTGWRARELRNRRG